MIRFIISLLSLLPLTLYAQPNQSLSSDLRINNPEFLEDKDSIFTISDLQANKSKLVFRPTTLDSNFGFSQSTYWLKFNLEGQALNDPEPLVLTFGYSLIDELQLHIPLTGTDQYQSFLGGRKLPFAHRAFNSHLLHFQLPTDQLDHDRPIYIQAKTSSSHQYPIKIFTRSQFLSHYLEETLASRLYMGAIAIMIFYNLIFLLMTLDSIYLIYICFVSVSALQVLSVQGFTYQFFWPQAVDFNASSIPFLMFSSVWLISLFSLLSLEKLKEHRFSYYSFILCTLFGFIGSGIVIFVEYKIAIKAGVILTLLSSLIGLIAYTKLSLRRIRSAYFYLLSIGALLIASLVYSLKAIGILPFHILTDSAPLIGSTLQVSLLTLALADRYRSLKNQNAKLQAHKMKLQRQLQTELQTRISIVADLAHRTNNPLHAGFFAVHNMMNVRKTLCAQVEALFQDVEVSEDADRLHEQFCTQFSELGSLMAVTEQCLEKSSQSVAVIRSLSGVDGHDRSRMNLSELFAIIEGHFHDDPELRGLKHITFERNYPDQAYLYGQKNVLVYVIGTLLKAILPTSAESLTLTIQWFSPQLCSSIVTITWPPELSTRPVPREVFDLHSNLVRPLGIYVLITDLQMQIRAEAQQECLAEDQAVPLEA